MELKQCIFYADLLKLSILDIFKLLLGRTIGKGTALRIKLWKMPDNGCPQCKEAK